MESNYKIFEDKAAVIRKKFRDFEEATNADKRLDAKYKQQTIKPSY